MQAVAYSNVRNNFKSFIRQVNDDADAVIIISTKDAENVVLISQTEYDNFLENAYIRNSEANVNHIMKSWQDLKNGKGKMHEWE